jgi:hypothetical protein
MGAVNTTYTFTATDVITSTKMNNIIDETVMTGDAVLGGSGGSGGLDIASGRLSISNGAINSSRLATNSVTTNAITDGSVEPIKLSTGGPIWSAGLNGATTMQPVIELGGTITSSTSSLIDFHSVFPLNDYDARILRETGSNGNFILNNIGTGSFILSNTDAGPMYFVTSSSERVTITSGGNVGIGTISPQAKLQVAGGKIRIEGHSGEGGQLELLNAANNDIQAIFDVDANDVTRIWTLPYEPLSFGTNTGERMRIDPDGNVGIGTTTPSTKLQVNGTVTATAFSGPLTGNASSASTVSDSAITAAKLNGSQSGSAPIYGIRAFGSVALGTPRTLGSGSKNLASTSRIDSTHTQVTFSTNMVGTDYVVSGCSRNDADFIFNTYDHQTNGFKIFHSTEGALRIVQFVVIE